MLYFILAYATVIASFISTIQTIIDLEVSPELGIPIILSVKQKKKQHLIADLITMLCTYFVQSKVEKI